MGLAQLVQDEHPQTGIEMAAAADERYDDALTLSDAGQHSGAVYLLGYVAEMVLKSAYFRLTHGGEALVTAWTELKDSAAGHAGYLGIASEWHSLDYWRSLITDERQTQAAPLAGDFKAQLEAVVDWLEENWCVDMRYAAAFADEATSTAMFCQTDWLVHNQVELWRV